MVKPPSAESILRNTKQAERKVETHADIATDMILPNNSGDHTKGLKREAPVNDYDIVNKFYVDGEITDVITTYLDDHPHQDVNTSASPSFQNITLLQGANNDINSVTSNVTGIWGWQATTSGQQRMCLWHTDDPATSILGYEIYSEGSPLVSANRARCGFLLNTADDIFELNSNKAGAGSGTLLPIRILIQGDEIMRWETNGDTKISGGDLYFDGAGTGLPYGCIMGANETITCTVQNTWYQVTFDTAGVSNRTTPSSANNDILIIQTGDYKLGVTACLHTANAQDIELMVKSNNGAVDNGLHLFQTTGVAGKTENVSGNCLADLTATGTLELWVRCTSAGAINVIFDHVNLNCGQWGG